MSQQPAVAALCRPFRIPARRRLRAGVAQRAFALPLLLGASLGLDAAPAQAQGYFEIVNAYAQQVLSTLTAYSEVRVTGTVIVSGATAIVGDERPWLLVNEGTVKGDGPGIDAVQLLGGSTLVNGQGNLVDGSRYAVVFQGGAGSVTNDGLIAGVAAGIEAPGGLTLANGAGTAEVSGVAYGVRVRGGLGIIANEGEIVAVAGTGLLLEGGGAVANSGVIGGSTAGLALRALPVAVTNEAGGVILSSAGVAVYFESGGGTFTNDGTLRGATALRLATEASVTNRGLLEGVSLAVEMSAGSISNEGTATGATGLLMSGGSFTNSGTLQGSAGAGAALAGGALLVNAAGGLIEGETAAVTSSGASLIENAGTLRGLNGLSLDLGAGDDLLTLTSGSRLEGEARGGLGRDSLVLTGSGAENDGFSAFERLEVAAGADWSLTGPVEMAEAAEIAGRLALLGGAAELETPEARVLSGGRLLGDGAVLGALAVEGGGRLDPGSGLGTLTVAGPLTLANGALLTLEVESSGASDRLLVGGSASLDGALDVTVLDSVAPGQTFLVLTAEGGISGSFDSITDNFALFGFETVTAGDELFLKVVGLDLGTVGDTPNQGSVGGAIGGILDGTNGNTGNSALDDLLDAIEGGDEEEVQALLGQLSGDIHASATQRLALAERAFLEGLAGRSLTHWHGRQEVGHLARRGQLASAGREELAAGPLPSRDPRGGGWLELTAAYGELEDRNAGNLEEEGYGATLGYDLRLSELGAERELLLGLALGLATLEADNAAHRARAEGLSYRAALYGRLTEGPLTLAAALGGSLGSLETERNLALGTFEERAEGGGDTASIGLAVEGAWGFALGRGLELVPLLGLSYLESRQKGFSESGAPGAGLSVGEIEAESLSSALAVRLSYEFPTSGTLLLEPEARIGWRHEYLERAAAMRARFTAAPAGFGAFGVTGAEGATDLLQLAAGLTASWREGTYLTADYQLEAAADETRHSLAFGLRVTF